MVSEVGFEPTPTYVDFVYDTCLFYMMLADDEVSHLLSELVDSSPFLGFVVFFLFDIFAF